MFQNNFTNKDRFLTIYEDNKFKKEQFSRCIRGECVCNESAIYIPVLFDGFVILHLKNTHKSFDYLRLRVINFVNEFNEFIQNKNIEVFINFNKHGEAKIAFSYGIKHVRTPIINEFNHLVYADKISIPNNTIELSRYD